MLLFCKFFQDSLQKLIKSQEENLKSLLNEKKNLLLKMDENNKKIILLEEKLNSTNKSDLKGNQTFSLLRENQMKIKKLPTIKNEKSTFKLL